MPAPAKRPRLDELQSLGALLTELNRLGVRLDPGTIIGAGVYIHSRQVVPSVARLDALAPSRRGQSPHGPVDQVVGATEAVAPPSETRNLTSLSASPGRAGPVVVLGGQNAALDTPGAPGRVRPHFWYEDCPTEALATGNRVSGDGWWIQPRSWSGPVDG